MIMSTSKNIYGKAIMLFFVVFYLLTIPAMSLFRETLLMRKSRSTFKTRSCLFRNHGSVKSQTLHTIAYLKNVAKKPVCRWSWKSFKDSNQISLFDEQVGKFVNDDNHTK